MTTTNRRGGNLGEGFTRDDDPARPLPMEWATYADRARAEWYDLLARDPEERDVQSFLELHPAMVPGGFGDVGPGGHHGSEMDALFREPPLTGRGREFEPDFMWVTRSTSLITPIIIEIEKPSKRWFKSDGRPTAEFRDAHDQLADWRTWFSMEENRTIFRRRYLFFDQYENRQLQPQFVLIYGRSSEFERGGGHRDPDRLRLKRDNQRLADEQFMTFDSLRPRYESSNSVTVTMTAEGPRPHSFSPLFGTTTFSGSSAIILGSDIDDALGRSVMITDERRAYLADRWRYWNRRELEQRRNHRALGERVAWNS
ncbi:Shedu anti-phage system protein SduA domain-containing protein [Nocardia asiatica]|uniref:Shedu anti-phage system protein SduA domain-containing protein n=1 Tax=Nocardia asiatica TaxID=209252 RepID=UPI003EE31C88